MPQPLVMRLREKTGEKKKKPDKTTAFQLPSHPAKHFRREMEEYSRPCIGLSTAQQEERQRNQRQQEQKVDHSEISKIAPAVCAFCTEVRFIGNQ